jgi:hypothetical protein
MPTRLCQYCRRYRPSDTCLCVTETNTRPDGTTTTRNIFYCSQCEAYTVTNCLACRTRIRQSSSHWIGSSAATNIVETLRNASRPYGVFRDGFHRQSEYLCADCYSAWGPWNCRNCNNHNFTCAGQSPHTPDGTDATYCSTCAISFMPCVRCQKPYAHRESRNLYNSHMPQHGRICNECKSTRFIGTSFRQNPFPQLCGYEIEFVMPSSCTDNLHLEQHGVIKYDGSIAGLDSDNISGSWQGWEFNSYPASGDSLVDSLYTVIKAISAAGGLVNRTCGIHFHFDMSSYNTIERDNFVYWWRCFEPILFDLVTASRRNNRYCGSGAQGDRYRALNWHCAYQEHGTYEVRMHHATLNPDEVWSFCHMLLSMFATLPRTNVPSEIALGTHNMTKRELAILLFQQCAMSLSMRRRIVQRLRTINSRQYRAHHWRRHKRQPDPTTATTAPPPAPTEPPTAPTTPTFPNPHYHELREMIARHGGA